MTALPMRTEHDTLGPIDVDTSRSWGAQTERSRINFPIGWERQPEPIIRGLGVVKRAAAEVNVQLGRLDAGVGAAIVAAAQEVIDGRLADHFPLVFLGSPTPDAPGCLVLDVRLPGLSGVDLQRRLAECEAAPTRCDMAQSNS